MESEKDCIFCKIVAGEIPSQKVYEDESVLAFKDIHPMAKVHVLIVPKKHFKNVEEISASDPDLLAHIVEVASKIANEKYDGSYRLVFNTGLDVGQTVFHAHAHVLTGEKLAE
ncbi:MAG: histidine triad nucleotide-binding protein [Aeriscardovia sp.]|nr:histidine triad nucleotide-binding protein [Aeriscardovia sp.]